MDAETADSCKKVLKMHVEDNAEVSTEVKEVEEEEEREMN